MPINPSIQIPIFCKNCTHRFVCSIQGNIKEQDNDVTQFNTDNTATGQRVTAQNYSCSYKAIDETL